MEKLWFECKKCGYAFDYFESALRTNLSGKRYILYICRDCYRPIMRNKQNNYYKTKNGKVNIIKARIKSEKRYPEKVRARQNLHYHLNKGNVKRLPCEICGEVKVQAHHHDYSKPLDVRWLCTIHHRELHTTRHLH